MDKWNNIFKHKFIYSYDDLSAVYELILDEDYTLKEFLDDILQIRAESVSGYPFGIIFINETWRNIDTPQIKYEDGQIIEVTHDIDLSQIVTRVVLHENFGCNLNYEVKTNG